MLRNTLSPRRLHDLGKVFSKRLVVQVPQLCGEFQCHIRRPVLGRQKHTYEELMRFRTPNFAYYLQEISYLQQHLWRAWSEFRTL